MYILTIRTDSPDAEVGLFNDQEQLAYETWHADRELSATLNKKVVDVLMTVDIRLHDLGGIVTYKGPGSFTGLRIGMTVANAICYGLNVPVVSETGDGWIVAGIDRLLGKQNERVAVPEYGALPNITTPKH